jgi:hypothetical protein
MEKCPDGRHHWYEYRDGVHQFRAWQFELSVGFVKGFYCRWCHTKKPDENTCKK